MKLTARIAAFLLAVCMIAGLCGCSSTLDQKLIGSWTCDIDLSTAIKEAVAEGLESEDAPGLAEAMAASDVAIVLPLNFIFNADGTMSITYDLEGFENTANAYFDSILTPVTEWMADFMYQSFEDMGITKDQADEAMLATYGMDTVAYCSENVKQLIDEAKDEMTSSLEDSSDFEDTNGYFKTVGDKLFTSDTEGVFNDDDYVTYIVDGDKLSIDHGGEGSEDFFAEFEEYNIDIPMIFTKNA